MICPKCQIVPPATKRTNLSSKPLHGFTLVELLVVIVIISILIALLLPAVQSAREAVRMLQCRNHLRQIALACLNHEIEHGYLPSAGWYALYAGDPTRGFAERQPGGWLYNILPYMELTALHELGADADSSQLNKRLSTPVAMYHCPSRRAAINYPFPSQNTFAPFINVPAPHPANVGRNDYAGAGGEIPAPGYVPGSIAEGDAMSASDWAVAYGMADTGGILYGRSTTTMRSITDGTSHTYLAGEKYLNTDSYENGLDPADDQSWAQGFDWDTLRFTSDNAVCQPQRDRPGYVVVEAFGSAHSGVFNMAFCDGSVRLISYSIDVETHHRLGIRNDGLVADGTKF